MQKHVELTNPSSTRSALMMLCNIRPICAVFAKQYHSSYLFLFVIISVFACHIIQRALHVVMKYEMRNESINLFGGGSESLILCATKKPDIIQTPLLQIQ